MADSSITCFASTSAGYFRFPKSPPAAAELDHELALLPRLRGRLPIRIPDPKFAVRDGGSGRLLFMGYPMLPGEPLLRGKFAALQDDEDTAARIAHDLAYFLRALHRIPPAAIGLTAGSIDSRQEWRAIYAEVLEKLFPQMRVEARRDVSSNFEAALNDDDIWHIDACLIHGDFGTGNILYQDGRISGIIDWSFRAFGDPAQDLGALLASYGEAFVARVCAHYPALADCLTRARFYRGNYALIQALYALRDNNPADFEDGMADYR